MVLSAAGCGGQDAGEGENDFFPAPAPDEGMQVGFSAVAPAGEEIWKCLVMDQLPTDETWAYVNRAVHKQTPFVHHMDLMALAFANVDIEPGEYDCEDLYQGEQSDKLMDDAVILYASQKGDDEVQLPEGIVAEVPTRSPFMYELHYVNTSDEDVVVESYVNAYTIEPEDVRANIWGGATRDLNINIPPQTQDHVEWTRCVMTDDVDLLFMSSHTHELARSFQVRAFDGETVAGDMMYENRDWQSPNLKHFDPPLKVNKGEGFEFSCHYASNRDTETNWGFTAQDEMCQIALVFTPGDASVECEIVESSDGVIDF